MSITVEIKSIYGNEMIYPADENARRFANLTGKKTLSRSDIQDIKALGFAIQIKQVELAL